MKSSNSLQTVNQSIIKASKLLIFALLFLLIAPNASAKIWYVMYNGGPANPNTTATYATGSTDWAHAGWGIRQTVDAAQNGDEIWVAGGDVDGGGITKMSDHYRMDKTMELTKDIKIIGGFPRPNAIIGVTEPTMLHRDMVKYATIFDGSDMTGDKKLFNMAAQLTNASFDGFYVINGSSGWGAGIFMQGGLTISNCVFANNKSTDPAGSNLAGGGAIHATGGKIINCIFTNNQAGNKGGAVFLDGTSIMVNCTVVNNKVTNSGDVGAGVYLWGTQSFVLNTVFWNNSGGNNDVDWGNGAQSTQIMNCAYNRLTFPDISNILITASNTGSANSPYFVTPSNTATPGVVAGWSFATLGNWYLKNAMSALWDKGDNQYITPYSSVDIVNRPRIRNGIVDIGAYEVQPLSITGAIITPKTYDGSAVGAMNNNGSLIGVIAPDVVTINSVGVAYSDKNAATPKNVRLTYTLAGADGTKYFVEPIDTIFAISKRPVTVTADAKSKIYSNSAATDPALTYQITSGSLVAGENFTGSLSRVAGETVTAPGPTYQIQQNSLDAGSNYTLTYAPANLTITKKDLTITGITILDRTFTAGNFTAPISSWGSLTGIIAPDAVSLVTTGITGSYTTDAAGGNKLVTFTANPTLTGAQSGNYSLTMPVVKGNVGVSSTVITLTYPTLVYDGNSKTVTSTHFPEDIVEDIVTTKYYKGAVLLAGSPSDAGTYNVEVVVSGNSFNSTVLEPFTITPKPLTLTTPNTAKTYDKTLASTKVVPTLIGVIAADVLNVTIVSNATQPSATFTTATAGIGNKVVNITGIALTGSRAFNYSAPTTAQNITSTINKKTIAIIADSTSKVYDALTTITKMPVLSFAPGAILSGDDVTMTPSPANASYDNAEAGINKTVTITNILLGGTSLGNYSIVNSASNSNCVITRRTFPEIQILATPVTKIYNGDRKTPIPTFSLSGIIGGDDVVVSTDAGTYGLFDTKDVGINKEAGFVGIILSGTKLNNYIIPPNVTTYLNSITAVPLNDTTAIVVADTTKTYDGTTAASVAVLTVKGLALGDTLHPIRTTATAIYDNKNVGTAKTVTVTGWTFTPQDSITAKNYTWETSYANKNSSITQYIDTINTYIEVGTATKIYDAKTTSIVPPLKIIGLLPGDNISPLGTTATATFDNKNVGNGKKISVTGWTFTPSDSIVAKNYLWRNSYATASGTITPFDVTVTPDAGQRQKYDEIAKPITYTTAPTALPNNEILFGALDRQIGLDDGFYKILQGTITNQNNTNYNITFTSDASFEIYSGIPVEKKWGYTLVVNNSKKEYKGYQWYKDGNLVPGQTLQWYSIEKPLCGVYKALITLNDGTKVFSRDMIETSSCLKKASIITLAPTRVSSGSLLTITNEGEANNSAIASDNLYTISIFSITGVKIADYATEALNAFTFSAPSTSGTYIVKIEKATNLLVTQKIVIY